MLKMSFGETKAFVAFGGGVFAGAGVGTKTLVNGIIKKVARIWPYSGGILGSVLSRSIALPDVWTTIRARCHKGMKNGVDCGFDTEEVGTNLVPRVRKSAGPRTS